MNAGLVSLIAVIIAVGAWRAMLHTGNRGIGFVIAAFALVALKSVLKALILLRDQPESPLAEFAFSTFDLAFVALVAWPILRRRPTRGPKHE